MQKRFIKAIANVNKVMQFLKDGLKIYLVDKTISLDDRWNVYKECVNKNIISEYDNWGPSLNTLNKLGIDSPYDYLHCDKYQKMDYLPLIEKLNNHIGYDKGIWKNINLTAENINEVKEEILTRFPEIGFIYDW